MKRAKVENHSNLERDLKTTAIVNTDTVAYERYINERNTRLRYEKEMTELRAEIEVLKSYLRAK